ncbi:MAG: hypothetical protein AAF968_26430 [Pseudomonadota bacterium]
MEFGYFRYLRQEGEGAFERLHSVLRAAGIDETRIFGDAIVMPGDQVFELWDCVEALGSGDVLVFACTFSLAPEIRGLRKLVTRIERQGASAAVLDARGRRQPLAFKAGWLVEAMGFLEDWEAQRRACEKLLVRHGDKPRLVRPRWVTPAQTLAEPPPSKPQKEPKAREPKPKARVWAPEMLAYAYDKRHHSSMPVEDICDALRTSEADYATYLDAGGELTDAALEILRAAAKADGFPDEPPLEVLRRQPLRHRVLSRFRRKGGR